MSADPDDCIFPNVDVETSFGSEVKTRCRIPIMTGALSSTFIAAKYWQPLAVGAALCGIPIVIGENVVGVDRASTFKDGKVNSAPELDRRVDAFLPYFDGYGTIIVQMNVEDTRNGVAEYLIDTYGGRAMIELKWGQGAKNIGGEIQVTSLEYAKFLKQRGYIVDPDPLDPVVQTAFEHHAITSFARHSRLGATRSRHRRASAGNVRALGGTPTKAWLRANLAQDRRLRNGSTGHGGSLLRRGSPRSANRGWCRRGHRDESMEHDGALGGTVPALAREDA
jgi:hypothetical protein